MHGRENRDGKGVSQRGRNYQADGSGAAGEPGSSGYGEIPNPWLLLGTLIIEQILDLLAVNGIEEVRVNVDDLVDALEAYGYKFEENGMTVDLEKKDESPARPVSKGSGLIGSDETFVVVGDVLTERDIMEPWKYDKKRRPGPR